jgi:proteasome lid subunit RPN8/RPN11
MSEMAEPPKIVKEIRKPVEPRPPPDFPQFDGVDLSEWDLSEDIVELYISFSCFQKMIDHCTAHMGEQEEVMGLLLGDVFQWKNRVYTVAEDTVAADAEDSTATSVRFGSAGLDEVARSLDEVDYEYLIVGWYHSHPGFTTFLSEKDLETQKKNFNKPFHATIVIDPVNRQFRSYKVIEDRYVEKRFSLFEQSPMERELTEKRRKEIVAYIDELVLRHMRPVEQGASAAAPGEREKGATRTRLPEAVRQTIEDDIKRVIEEHKKTDRKG